VRLTLRYFAWLRERVGAPEETVETGAATVGELVEELTRRDEAHALAFADLKAVRVAVDEELADLSAPLEGAREVAFFPPMTGG
jgi:molybdopterin synthase sulfur carrier subunit